MKRRSLFLALAQAAAFSSYAATIRVTTNNDVDAMECTLRDAIVSANTDTATGACDAGSGADTIEFDLVTPATISVQTPLPTVLAPIAVVGPGIDQLTIAFNANTGISVQGNAMTPGFSLSGLATRDSQGFALALADTVTSLNDISISENTGTAILADNTNLTVSQATLSNLSGQVGVEGAALWMDSLTTGASTSSLLMENSTITGVANGAVLALSNTATFNNCGLYENERPPLIVGGESITLDGVTISENSGGLFAIVNRFGVVTVHNSDFVSNQMGVIYAREATVHVSDSTFMGNGRSASGGAVALFDSAFVGERLQFEGNTINGFGNSDGGGAIWQGPLGPSSENRDFILRHSTFTGNSVGPATGNLQGPQWFGGAIYLGSSNFQIEHSEFAGNTASAYGGAIAIGAHSTGSISDAIFHQNQSNTGGAIAIAESSGSITIQDSLISGNQADFGGGVTSEALNTVEIIRSEVYENSARSHAGIHGVFAVRDSTVHTNAATFAVGGVGDVAFIENSTISNNSAPLTSAISSSSGNVKIRHSTITSNAAGQAAQNGAIGVAVFQSTVPSFYFYNSIISNNGGNCRDFYASFVVEGANHFNDTSCNGTDSGDPMLTEVASNGGPTPTQHPRAGSPVIDAADPAFCPPFDQRGEIRGATPCDIGAVEVVDINQPPRIDDQSFVIDSGFVPDDLVGPLEFSDPEMLLGADPLSIIGPDHGFRVEADGMVFVDSAIVPGATTLTVEVTDPGGLSDRATIVIDVVELPLFADGFEQ